MPAQRYEVFDGPEGKGYVVYDNIARKRIYGPRLGTYFKFRWQAERWADSHNRVAPCLPRDSV